MILPVVFLILGLLGVWVGAYMAVQASQNIGKSLNLTDAFIGLTILSIGTSLPEIFTHIIASIDILKGIDASGIAVGTNVGSNIIQITLIAGLIGLLATVKSEKSILRFDYPIMLGAIALLWIFGLDGRISRLEGALMVLAYIVFIVVLATREKMQKKNSYQANYVLESIVLAIGFAVLIYCANLVVSNAIFISETFGILKSFVGAMIIGVCTALPELTTAVVAILKGSKGMSLGTLIGSNITNPMFALGLGAVISGYSMDSALQWFDIPFWFVTSFIIMGFFKKDMRLSKREALIMIGFYAVYAFIRIKWFM